MKDTPNRRAAVVGIFVFIGTVFLIAGILIIGDLHETFTNKMEVVSLFDNVGGLQKGNNVWYSGVKIGTVSNLDFFGKSQVEVTMKVDKKTQQYIRKDAKVKISSDGFIGNKILVIYGGTEQFAQVNDGDTLEVEKTFTTEDMINTLQENNKNILVITNDFKTLSKKLVDGEGTLGKLLNDNTVYANINAATLSLQRATDKADQIAGSLAVFSENLNKKGTLANELTTDTVVFNSLKASVMQLRQIADTASVFIKNINQLANNPNTSIGVLLHDEETGTRLKATIKNLESGSKKLDEDLEAAQHNFLLRGFFKDKAKAKADSTVK
jgi:phospholipid/cholesterol/gamma-HCH transport system substrate-binding protein